MKRGPLGAQTERRGGAGPAGGLLGGKDPTGRFCFPVRDRPGFGWLILLTRLRLSPDRASRVHLPRRGGGLENGQGWIPIRLLLGEVAESPPGPRSILLLVFREREGLRLVLDRLVEVSGFGTGHG